MKKILSLFLALLTVSVMNAKVAFLVPADNTNEISMQYEEAEGQEQSPERRAWRWFNDNFVTPGNGQFICFNDLSGIPTDINAIWIYVDRKDFNRDAFDALFTAERKAYLQTYLNAGGNLFLCKQATRLEKDLVGAKKSDNTILEPTYNCGGYITNYNREEKWGMSVYFYDGDGWGSYLSHAMFAPIPDDHKGNARHIEMIWSEPLEHVVTNNNCLFELSHMEMGGVDDFNALKNFQSRNNCRVLGGWSNGNGCHCGGLIEFYPSGDRKGTVIMMGLAAYQWINNNNGWGIENIQYMTKGALDYLNARPCAGDNITSMEDKFANDAFFYPSNTATFRTLHPDCEGLAAAYSLTSNPNEIARIVDVQEGENTVKKLQFKAAGTVTLHIVLTENREFKNWPKGTYEYDREITFAYADENAAQNAVNEDFPANGVIEEEGVQMAMRLHPSVRGMDSISYTITNHYDETQGEAYKETKEGVTRLYFSKSGKVLLTARLNETDWVEAWPVGEKVLTRVVEFSYTQETGPAFTWPSEFETGAVGPNSIITLPETAGGLAVTYTVEGNGSIEGNVLTLANVTSGTVTVHASVTENDVKVTWPKGTYTFEKTLSFHAAEVGYLLPAAESIDHLAGWYNGEQPEYNAAKWFQETYIATGKGRFVTVEELPTLFDKGIKALWVNIERIDITTDEGMFTDMPAPLKTYIQAGGNVLLTKQATRLAYLMGRIGYAPAFNAGGYSTVAPDYRSRSIATKMGISLSEEHQLDMSGHAIYEGMLSYDEPKNVYLVAPECNKTMNYCSWQDFFTDDAGTQHAYGNGNIQRMRDFENAWNATVLGIQGNIYDYCLSNVVEFNATGDWQGRILTIGSAAYQWGSSNNGVERDNMKRLTSNSLAYLNNEEPEAEVYTRTVTSGNYGTICLPMASFAIEGATMYRIVDKDATGITIEEVASMAAGTPYIFQASADEIRVTMTGQSSEVQPANGLIGNLGEEKITVPQGENYYVLSNNALYQVNSEVTIATNRAYINIGAITGQPQAQGMRRRVIAVQNTATGLGDVQGDNEQWTKVIRDGQLFILRDGKTYNVQGQMVK